MRSDYSKNETQKNLILQLNEKLIECMENNKSVSIHLHTGKVIIRMAIIPDEVIINENEVCLEYNSICFSMEDKIDHIEYVDDYEYDCYYVMSGNTEMFFDFI